MTGAASPPVVAAKPAGRLRWCILATSLAGLLGFTAAAVPFGDLRESYHGRILVSLLWGAGACFLVAASQLRTVPARWQGALLAAIALLLRVILLPMEPGDDFWRYLWEGRVQNAGYNPYLFSPSSPELVWLRDERWAQINHPEVGAVYPPLVEMLLATATRLPNPLLLLKCLFATADLVTAILLWKLVPPASRVYAVAMFAWNPAVAYASAGGGHFDSLMVCALTSAIFTLHRAQTLLNPVRNICGSAAFLGLAAAVKIVPLMLLPLWAWTSRRHWYVLVAPAVILIVPAYFYGGSGAVTANLRSFTDVARFHELFWWAVEWLTIPNPYQRNWPFTLVLGLAVVAITIRMRDDWPRAALWILGAALILSPVLHPWYATWILPLACWRKQHAWTVLTISALASLLMWESSSLWTAWQPNWFTRSLVILPPLIWLLFERRQQTAAT